MTTGRLDWFGLPALGARPSKRTIGVAAVAIVIAMVGFALLPGLIWRGVAVVEPCEAKVSSQYGPLDEVHVLREEIHLRWLPPHWVCPLSNGDEITP